MVAVFEALTGGELCACAPLLHTLPPAPCKIGSSSSLAQAHHPLAHDGAQACELNPASALPHLGLAQMELRRAAGADTATAAGAITNATTELEKAIKDSPAFFDALKVGRP